MSIISNNRKEYSDNIGKKSEQLFVQACNKIGYKCIKTDKNTDIYDHIDFYVERPDGTTSVDVKGNNTINCIWVEFKNVKGNDGWLYGKSKYIAFDMPELNGFVLVNRNELKNRCEDIVENVFVSKSEAFKKLYTRLGRMDVISQIRLKDISDLKSYKIINY